ncbi:MAG: molybdopterin-dependent oxidoreductase [Dehalococcoidia bacterium]
MTGGALAATRFVPFGSGQGPSSIAEPVEDFVPTTCWIGKQDCGILARRVDGRVVRLEGHPDHPRNLGTLCPKGVAQIQALYDPNRVRTPLIRTNEKGVPGTWREASWDEALDLVATRINEARTKGPGSFVWQKGRSKAEPFYDNAFVKASGALKLHHGAYCSDAGYRALEYTLGLHGVLHPDFRYTEYILAWGWNITNAGGNKLCWLTWPRLLTQARDRGLKVVSIDPRVRGAGPHADRWVPIRPGTDLALALALCHEVLETGSIDRDYLLRYTNAPWLVRADGTFLRRDEKEQVWDIRTGRPAPWDDPNVEPALEGAYRAGGEEVRTVLDLFREHVAAYTADWASDVCGIPAESVRRIASELVQHARIGSTIVVDGVPVPHRPVGIMAYHVAQQELGFQAVRAMLLLMMLLGSVGAAGGQHADFGWKLHDNYQKLDQVEISDGPYNLYLDKSRFYPINSNNTGVVAKVMLEPDRYGLATMPEAALIHMTNLLASFPSQKDLLAAFQLFKFIAVIDPWLSLTADFLADVVLPAATMEKYEGPLNVGDPETDAVSLRVPVMDPLFESRGDIDIYLDLTERMGILYGDDGYLAQLNAALKLPDELSLPLDTKLAVREIFDRWARSQGIDEGVAYFETTGVKIKGRITPTKSYGYATDPPFGGRIHRLYGESLLRYQQEMQAKGSAQIYWQDYTAFPTWRAPTFEASPPDYDLYLVSYKLIEFKQSRASMVPLLAELAPEQHLEMNPAHRGWHALQGCRRQVHVLRATHRKGARAGVRGELPGACL